MNVNRIDAHGRELIVVKPAAQSGAAAGAAERLKRFLTRYCHREAFDIAQTERPRHATEIAAGAAEYDTVIALGGDGVVHEVACGLMRIEEGRRPTLGVIPVGSGNARPSTSRRPSARAMRPKSRPVRRNTTPS